MNKLHDLITAIINRPELYLGKSSIQRMYAYIGGFLHQNNDVDDHCLEGFNEYVAARYKINSDHNWADIIEFFSINNQDEIIIFKQLFDDFTQKRDSNG